VSAEPWLASRRVGGEPPGCGWVDAGRWMELHTAAREGSLGDQRRRDGLVTMMESTPGTPEGGTSRPRRAFLSARKRLAESEARKRSAGLSGLSALPDEDLLEFVA
jgi:hypothetical protein